MWKSCVSYVDCEIDIQILKKLYYFCHIFYIPHGKTDQVLSKLIKIDLKNIATDTLPIVNR